MGVNAANDLPFILEDPEPGAIIVQVGDSNIVLEFRAWIDQRHSDFGKARSLAICAVKDALETAGFTLPEPIYRLRVDSLPELAMRDLSVWRHFTACQSTSSYANASNRSHRWRRA